MNQFMISVIIPTYHRNDLLAKCLDLLAPGVQTFPADKYQVIVSDDGYKTTAEEMIREHYPWVKWVAGPRKGPASNRNNGAKYAQGEWLAFIDDDCLPNPNWLSGYAEAIKGESLALEGAIHPLGDRNQDLCECPVNLTGGCFWSANIAVKRSLFEEIGGFDSNYSLALGEDVDLQQRLSALTKISFVPNARVDHPVRLISLKQAIAAIPKRSAANAYHMNKHKRANGHENALDITFFFAKYTIGLLLNNLLKGKLKSVLIELMTLLVGVPLLFKHLWRIESTNVANSDTSISI
ncbi:glycosyltransferase [Scytonema hofmannii FACHB-248]|uniref:Glycosyltransferase n=1 Tax=Scytonema hofmannii FACHB-248 TaxID=1842502 RepID=A0ABR8GP52_9CYAN|nr:MULTISPECIES: glycosyltransferase family A protein [Nostocales]MBD2605207.1 glycosyltransferase [Scytonema hofmannii FACHB-248]